MATTSTISCCSCLRPPASQSTTSLTGQPHNPHSVNTLWASCAGSAGWSQCPLSSSSELSNNCSSQCRSITSGFSVNIISFIVGVWPCMLPYSCSTFPSSVQIFCENACAIPPYAPFPDSTTACSTRGTLYIFVQVVILFLLPLWVRSWSTPTIVAHVLLLLCISISCTPHGGSHISKQQIIPLLQRPALLLLLILLCNRCKLI
ncbi:Uncharacterised protein [Chlamydia trachomatis]|nr:Uncharacterised protein [Chlamydia trachomatis]